MNYPTKPIAAYVPFTPADFPSPGGLIASVASVAMAVASSASVQTAWAAGPKTAAQDRPVSMQGEVSVMVEMKDAPAAVPYGQALKAAHAAARGNAVTSRGVLKSPEKVEISAADASLVKEHVQSLDKAQQAVLPALANAGGKVIFRTQRAYNGIAIKVSQDKISEIAQLPGVKAVHPMHPKFQTAFSDIDFLGARSFWNKPEYIGGVHGENIKVAIIDSGLDYVHTNFGGTGNYTGVGDLAADTGGQFPSAKVPGGYDFAGDSYSAGVRIRLIRTPIRWTAPTVTAPPAPVLLVVMASISVGPLSTGPYEQFPNIGVMKISPGFAPKAELYPLRVFGISGSTNLTTQAIDWAMDPNGDDEFFRSHGRARHALGSNEGYTDDDSAVAAANAAQAEIVVTSAAGNGGDSYYMHSSPASASGTLSVAATFNNQAGFISDSNVTANAPVAIAGQKYGSIKGSNSSAIPAAGITGDVVYAVPTRCGDRWRSRRHDAFGQRLQVAGKIVLIDRGTSGFTDKVTKGFNAGAIAVIVNNFISPAPIPSSCLQWASPLVSMS